MPSLSISARELLTSGVHYGHKVSRWNPKMRPYIHAKKSLIHIIDVRETIKGLVRAWHFLQKLASRGELILFVGTLFLLPITFLLSGFVAGTTGS